MKPTQLQVKYLRERLDSIRRSKPSQYEALNSKEPASVTTAKKQIERYTAVVDAWESKISELRKQRNQSISKAHDNCRRLIEFGDAQEALKAIDEFEAKEF